MGRFMAPAAVRGLLEAPALRRSGSTGSIEQVSRWFTNPIEDTITVPTGCTVFPREVPRPSRRLVERRFTNIVHWGEPERGGHFGAWEQPDRFVAEVRAAATAMQSGSSQASGHAD